MGSYSGLELALQVLAACETRVAGKGFRSGNVYSVHIHGQ